MEKFEQLSPSEFFYRYRSIAGFTDERALYQAVREAVENALDSCEVAQVLPFIRVKLKEEFPEKNLYSLTVSDNGTGIPPSKIPDAFGRMLFGSKYGKIRQSRGIFGLGIKMAVLYSQIKTNQPVRVLSSTGTNVAHDFLIKIDLKNNVPIILRRNVIPNPKMIRGTLISMLLEGKLTETVKSRIKNYLMLTTISNPSATIECHINGEVVRYERSSQTIPKLPANGKPHPKGVDIEALKRMAEGKNISLLKFLCTSFDHLGEKIASEFLKESKLNPNLIVGKMRDADFEELYRKLSNYEGFMAPSTKMLSPIGEKEFEAAVKKRFNPDFVKAVTRPPSSYLGNPFIVEVCIAYGNIFSSYGKGIQVFRFANKIPLLYDLQGDLFWTVVRKIPWQNYKVNPKEDPVALFCHLCSTKISYKTAGKEMLAHIAEIYNESRRAILKAARALTSFLLQQRKQQYQRKRLGIYECYLPEIARNVSFVSGIDKEEILNNMWKVVKGEDVE